jgi:hypothetical protein
LEIARLRWVAMKWGLEIREYHVLETQMNLTSDFTGSRERISTITSFGRCSSIFTCLAEAVVLMPKFQQSQPKSRRKEITEEKVVSH